MASFETGNYRNLFQEIGKSEEEIQKKLDESFNGFFFGDDRVYETVGEDMAYIQDTGNIDVRTEGMSYGMMICVQCDQKEMFDRLWKWAKTYMWMDSGVNEGYFAWSCQLDGTKNSYGPAPDGEEFFAMALFFASHRWGDGEGIYCYSHEAQEILKACLHKGENNRPGAAMWNRENKQILFVPGSPYTDASYHLPHFYELFALWAAEEDRAFWKEAAQVSREYLAKACHPVTGMSPEYGEFDGTPSVKSQKWTKDRHDWFYSDAYRTAANIGLDAEWFGIDAGQMAAPGRLIDFLSSREEDPYVIYEIDGTPLPEKALHPVALLAATAQGALAVGAQKGELTKQAKAWVERFWEEPLRTGVRRYYDNCLYLFALLALSGRYRIWR
jgi:oligosaccharide reducing-end xylanase